MSKIRVEKYLILSLGILLIFILGTGGLASLLPNWPNITIPLEVKEPIEILYYTSELSLFPGENKSVEATVQNHAAISYNVTLDFRLSVPAYQAAYVTFSETIYTVAPGQQNLSAWVVVNPAAPAITCSLTIDVRRGDRLPTYEDFTTYTEALGDGSDRYTQTTTQSSWAGLRRDDAVAYVYKDYGVGAFTTFEHQMELHISAISSGNDPELYRQMVLPFVCSTDTPAFSDDRLLYYIMKKPDDDTKYYVTFMAWHNKVDSMHASSRYSGIYFDVGTTYYVTVSKSGSMCRLVLRAGSHRGAIVWDSGDCTWWNDNYQYLSIPYHVEYTVGGDNTIDGYVKNLNLQPSTEFAKTYTATQQTTKIIPAPPKDTEVDTFGSMWIKPSTIVLSTENLEHRVGYRFNVTVWVDLTLQSSSWEFAMLYNKTHLKATGCNYTGSICPTCPKSQFFANVSSWPFNAILRDYNSTHGYVLHAEVTANSQVRNPGQGSLAWVEFEVIAEPPMGEILTSLISISTLYPSETYVQDDTRQGKVPLNTYDCSYSFSDA